MKFRMHHFNRHTLNHCIVFKNVEYSRNTDTSLIKFFINLLLNFPYMCVFP